MYYKAKKEHTDTASGVTLLNYITLYTFVHFTFYIYTHTYIIYGQIDLLST